MELRRIRADLVMCYKIIYGLVDIPFDAFSSLVLALPVAILLNYSLLFSYSDSRVNARAHAFPVRIVTLWNRLPAAIQYCQVVLVYSFKKSRY